MAKQRQAYLDHALLAFLDGDGLADKVGPVLELVTLDEDGAPHPALLSVGEVVATGDRRLRLALWRDSTTTRNLAHRNRALLTLVLDGTFYGISVTAHLLGPVRVQELDLMVFDGEVQTVSRDDVGYAELTSGLTYRLVDEASVLPRWQQTVACLRDPSARVDVEASR
ncbi:MAG: hypothetical protein ACRDYU_17725 [Actinomycetes bacterium]